MLALTKFREEDETGFTLIELLTVILIIGILAAIAIPMFINQRKSAVDAAVQSDVRNAAGVVETALITQQGTKTPVTAALVDGKATTSPGSVLAYAGDSDGYCVTGTNPGGDVAASGAFVYASLDGGMKTLDDSHVCKAGKVVTGTKPVALPEGTRSWSGAVQLTNHSLGDVIIDANLTVTQAKDSLVVHYVITRADGSPVISPDEFRSYQNYWCTDSTIDGSHAYGGANGPFAGNTSTFDSTALVPGCQATNVQLLAIRSNAGTTWGLVNQLDVALS